VCSSDLLHASKWEKGHVCQRPNAGSVLHRAGRPDVMDTAAGTDGDTVLGQRELAKV